MSKTFVSWVNLAFVQSKLLQKLNWSGIRRRWRMRSWGGFHASPAPFHWNHRCFKRWNCERTFSSAPPAKDKSFQRTTRDSNGLLIEKNLPWNFPRFVRVCSWLGSLDSPWPVARSCSSVFFCLNIIIFCWEGKKEEEVEINGSICVRFDTRCQPQGSSVPSRNCSLGPNWVLWDGLLTSGGGLSSLSLA